MLIKAVIAVVALIGVAVVAVLVLAAMKPDSFRVARSTSIKAPPEKIYPMIEDLHRFTAWSPYENRDPQMQRTYGGAAHGTGATYAWEGDKNVGSGRMQIIDAKPSSKVAIALDFTRPFEAHNTVEFTLEPKDGTTDVTWAMQGPVPFLAKIMHVFINMDRMVGQDFELGLANMKALAEK